MWAFLFFTTFCMIMAMNFGKFWIQMICVACYVFLHKLFDLWVVFSSIDWCTLYPEQCVVMFISLILEFSHKKVVRYFSKKRFIMAYQLSQSIYSMSIVASTCHWVFSYEVVNVIIFQCINLFLRFMFLCKLDTAATNGSRQWSTLVNVMKNVGGPNFQIIAKIVFLFCCK